MARIRVATLSSVLTLAAGCGGCGEAVSIDEMPAQVAQAMCAKVWSCCTAADLPQDSNLGPDQATCEANVQANQNGKRALIKSGQEKGRLVYRGEVLRSCLKELESLSCQAMKSNATSALPTCDAYLEPLVAEGQPCGQDEECIGGTCEGEGIGADGVCRLRVAEGGSCASASCGDGLYCEAGSKLCRATHSDGTQCRLNLECSTGGCNGVDPDAGTPGTCGLKGGAASTCFATTGCSAGGAGGSLALSFGVAALARRLLRRRRGSR